MGRDRAQRWAVEGPTWPHHAATRFVEAGGLRWHVQQMSAADGVAGGPVALLLHGTGASTHSWRGLMPLLARRFTVIAVDLPGHAFTDTPARASQLSLPGMAALLQALLQALRVEVALVVGHSAGAAIAVRLVLDGHIAPAALVAINGAFLPLAGLAGLLFPPVARLMAVTPLAAQLFARRSWNPTSVRQLIQGTGSSLNDDGVALYARLLRDPVHAAGALAMMSRWDLRPLAHDLARLRTPLLQLVGDADRAVPPADARRVQALLPAGTACSITLLRGAGHLAHEERPAEVAQAVLRGTAPGALSGLEPG